jgi:hypothetical protein
MSAPESRPAAVRALPVDFVVDVVNQWGSAPRLAAGEQDHQYPDLVALAAAHQIGDGPAARRLTDQDLTRVADALYPVFTAPTDDAVAAEVNELLARGAPAPRLGRDGGPLFEEWAAPASQQFLVACVLTLFQQLIQWGDSRRLGVCAGMRCADAYVDLSSARHKRYCSLTCQNRNRVAAFRATRRPPGGQDRQHHGA